MIRQVNSVPSHSVTQVYSSFFPLNLSPHVTITSDQIHISFTFQSSFPHNLFGKTLRYLSLSLSLSLKTNSFSTFSNSNQRLNTFHPTKVFTLFIFTHIFEISSISFQFKSKKFVQFGFFFSFFFFFNYKNQFNHTNSRFCRLNHQFPIFLAFSLMFIF